MFGIFAALAEFERELIRERTVDGLKAARARGRKGSSKFALTKAQVQLAQAAMAHGDTSVSALCRELGIRTVTLYRYVGPQGQLRDPPSRRRRRRGTLVATLERSGDLLERRLHAGHDRVVAVAGHVAARSRPSRTPHDASAHSGGRDGRAALGARAARRCFGIGHRALAGGLVI